MLPSQQVEELITLVSGLDKDALLRQFREYPASFPLDFTPDFLDHQPLETAAAPVRGRLHAIEKDPPGVWAIWSWIRSKHFAPSYLRQVP